MKQLAVRIKDPAICKTLSRKKNGKIKYKTRNMQTLESSVAAYIRNKVGGKKRKAITAANFKLLKYIPTAIVKLNTSGRELTRIVNNV